MKTFEAECDACGGTGVYCGFAEPPGVGVVCQGCDGSGKRSIQYKPFEGLKKRTALHKDKKLTEVRRSRGSFIGTGVGPTGKSVSYADFLQGKRP